MTGPVSWEVLIWVVGIIVTVAVAVAVFLIQVWNLVRKLRADWSSELKDRDLKIEAADARAKVIEDTLKREISDYRQHAGETFATKAGMSSAVERVESAVTRLSTQVEGAVDRLSGRIDQLLLIRAEDAPPPRRRTRPP